MIDWMVLRDASELDLPTHYNDAAGLVGDIGVLDICRTSNLGRFSEQRSLVRCGHFNEEGRKVENSIQSIAVDLQVLYKVTYIPLLLRGNQPLTPSEISRRLLASSTYPIQGRSLSAR